MGDEKANNLPNSSIHTMGDEKTNNLPNILLSRGLDGVKHGYHYLISHATLLLLVLLSGVVSVHLSTLKSEDLVLLWDQLRLNFFTIILCFGLKVLLGFFYLMTRPRKVYMVDFACYKPGPQLLCTRKRAAEITRKTGVFNEENLDFMKRILERAGLGEKTYFPEAFFNYPPDPGMAEARKEAEMVMFGAIDELLEKTGVRAKDIGILVVNCGCFCPTPSLSSMIVNHYKLRTNILSYNLGGMGCSAGVISIDLAKYHLQVLRNSYALVVSTENLTLNAYRGNNPSMLVSNALFRVGGTAILLSNKPSDRPRSKYQLSHIVRTHKGAQDKFYNCAVQQEDEDNKVGIALSKDLMIIAGEALKSNIIALAPLILPASKKLLYVINLFARKYLNKKIKPYVPDFKLALEHFCIHAGGRAVLDAVQKALDLSEWQLEPSRMTLYRFGNTSTSSTWYELAYLEAKGRVKKGDRAWQISFGAGFKCNSAVWRALKDIDPSKEKNCWTDEIDEFPVQVPKCQPLVLD
ncbi:3-ketoacyl-CoA synthase 20-like isoform X1 [Coffea eugenioides]|uniref:3-ketoacyl-CoA synthase 20-like isoform X1 n=2 Tax=Coffea eugenioides TaxID=49369 RepID=UPI000F608908|nr:3-ketoacyl-CoA synthase 20-like isoform X1 [Coffea eugenioides]